MGAFRKIYGDRLTKASTGEKRVPSLPSTISAVPPIQLNRWCRNGKSPAAQLLNQQNDSANQAVICRTKEVFRGGATFFDEATSGSTGDRIRWRFAFHTGPYAHALGVVVLMRPQDVGYDTSSYVRLDLSESATESPVDLSQTFVHGLSPLGATEARGWQYLQEVTHIIDGVSADTDYYGIFVDVDYARIQAATVFELASMTENTGYLANNVTAMSSVLDVYRQNLATITRALWRRGGSQVLNWYTGDNNATKITGRLTSSATPKNVVDDSSTSVSAATPGWTLSLTNHDRVSQTSGVPCVMKAFGSMSAGTAGEVYLKDSGGNTIASITNVFTTTPQWHSTTFNMPATTAKYDIWYATASDDFTLRAVSIYEHET